MEPLPLPPLSNTLFTTARCFLALVFLTAGVSKLWDGTRFATTLRALGVESPRGVRAARVGVPVAETTLAIWLLIGSHPTSASFVAAVTLLLFTVALLELRRRDAYGCACFPWDEGEVGVGHVLRNLFLIGVAVSIGTLTLFGRLAWQPVWELPLQSSLVAGATIAFLVVVYALIVTSWRVGRRLADDPWKGAPG